MTSRTDAEAAVLDSQFAAAVGSASEPKLSEKQLQEQIVAEAERLGCRVFWIPSAARTGIGRTAKTARGWPDLTIGGPRGVLFREVKMSGSVTTAEQDWWQWMLHNGHCDVGLWRPVDWQSGRIQAELQAIA